MFFDHWLGGIANFVPINARLQAVGIETVLLYLSSAGSYAVGRDQAGYRPISLRGIADYGGSLSRALDREAPDVVVMLTTANTANRLLNRLSRQRAIRTVYMMHGITPTGEQVEATARLQNREFSLMRRLARVPRYTRLIRQYLAAAAKDRDLGRPDLYQYFWRLIVAPGDELNRPRPHPDLWCDLALVYADVYKDVIADVYHYPPDRIVTVGNPNLDSAYALLAEPGAADRAREYVAELGVPRGRDAVLYLDDNFVKQGWWSDSDLAGEVDAVATAAATAGYDLIVKMHPSADPRRLIEHCRDNRGVHIVQTADLARLTLGCVAAVGHVSSTLMFPAIFGRPIFLPAWSPAVAALHFLDRHGVAQAPATPADLQRLLERGTATRDSAASPARDEFIRRYVTYTDGKAWDRISARLCRLIDERRLA
jgi:hypothetical protein